MKNKLSFFPNEDIIHYSLSDEEEADSIELSPNITAELNKKGEIIGIEILKASAYIRDAILDSAHLKMLGTIKKPRRRKSYSSKKATTLSHR